MRALPIAIVTTILTIHSTCVAEVPPRTESGLQLAVPAEHAAMGRVYYVRSSKNGAQVTFTSDALLEQIVGVSNRVLGYVVAEVVDDEPTGRLLAGGFRVPARTFKTGIPGRDGDLMSPNHFNAAAYADLSFALTDSDAVKVVAEGKEYTTYQITMRGDMTIKGTTHPLDVSTRLTFIPAGAASARMMGAPGNLLALRCAYTVKCDDYGIRRSRGDMPVAVANEIRLDQFFRMSDVSPEASFAGEPDAASILRVERVRALLGDEAPAADIAAYMRTLATEFDDSPALLSRLARTVSSHGVTDEALRELSIQAVTRANELTGHTHGEYLMSLGWVLYRLGDEQGAIEAARRALPYRDMAEHPRLVLRVLNNWEQKAGMELTKIADDG